VSSKEDSNGSEAFRELREYARGVLEIEHTDVYPWAGLIEDEEVRRILAFMEEVYDPDSHPGMPSEFTETEFFKRALKKHATEMATKAVLEGDSNRVGYITGKPGYTNDVSGMLTLQSLEDWLMKDTARMLYLAGHMGTGKTALAHLMMEVVMHRHSQEGVDVDVRTNIGSSELETIDNYPDLEEWMTTGSVDDEKWFIFDEASSELSGYSHDRARVEQLMSSLVKRMRKNGVSLIIIGHTGKDLHADLRRLCDFVKKQSKKTADLYATVKGGEGAGHVLRLDGIPDTSLDFDTEDEAQWDWGEAESEGEGLSEDDLKEWEKYRMGRLYTEVDHLEQGDIADTYDTSIPTVSRAASRFNDGDFPDYIMGPS